MTVGTLHRYPAGRVTLTVGRKPLVIQQPRDLWGPTADEIVQWRAIAMDYGCDKLRVAGQWMIGRRPKGGALTPAGSSQTDRLKRAGYPALMLALLPVDRDLVRAAKHAGMRSIWLVDRAGMPTVECVKWAPVDDAMHLEAGDWARVHAITEFFPTE